MDGRCAVFIDGGYLDKVLHYDFQNRRIDYEKLAQEMAAPDEMLRAHYYHCLPYRSSQPTTEERQRYSSMHRFITRLQFLPRFEVRLGRLVVRGYDRDGAPVFVQKRVDCMVGVDMALIAAKGRITHVAIFTGDSDLIPAVEAVKHESVLVTLWHGSYSRDTTPSRDLVEVCDERRQLDEDVMSRLSR
ncbi:MAG: NYN domain-containing protein [Phycisphaerae bacterium]